MKNQIVTEGIVLARTDFLEADRILTLLTPDQGKLKVIAKGVRRLRSKLAGGIELLSVSSITVLPGRGELGTLVSSRLITHYGNIVQDINRTMLAYEFLKRINRVTEDAAGEEYFMILQRTLEAVNDLEFSAEMSELWFAVQLLNVTGHMPDLRLDTAGQRLQTDQKYLFDFESMAFRGQEGAPFTANHIKLFRLAYAVEQPLALKQIQDAEACLPDMLKLATNLLRQQVRI
ncbi:MAG TPA: DNA repair protein RecO [Candidatus Limnocylindria bacterium]|nr:DNA repair protein RecO [Candidatus Limnocylindria bacterium]